MFKLQAAIKKEFQLLVRDVPGLALLFVMPILLVVLMTAIQNSAFQLVNSNKVKLLVINQDTSDWSNTFINELEQAGLYEITQLSQVFNETDIQQHIKQTDALAALVLPSSFSNQVHISAQTKANKALLHFGVLHDSHDVVISSQQPLLLYFNHILQESYRYAIRKGIEGVYLAQSNKLMIERMYLAVNEQHPSSAMQQDLMATNIPIEEKVASVQSNGKMPNASQHNVPAWTLFAMFFTVISISNNIIKEKRSGSFVRLKTLPTSYVWALLAKQLVFILVVLFQLLLIVSFGIFLFPVLNLPQLNLPVHLTELFGVTLLCGWVAISYAICIGVYARTQEQANGFGAISVVILAALGGIFIPTFAMPELFQKLSKLTPFYWCLQLFYGVFLENSTFRQLITNSIPLVCSILVFQLAAYLHLKQKHFI